MQFCKTLTSSKGVNVLVTGIDPGKTGGAVCISRLDGDCYKIHWAIEFDRVTSPMIFEDLNRSPTKVFIEKVGHIHGDGGKATFRFGREVGKIEAILNLSKINYIEVIPQLWVRYFRSKFGGVIIDGNRILDNKLRNIEYAKMVFGSNIELLEKSVYRSGIKYHTGMVDAALIAVAGIEIEDGILRSNSKRIAAKKNKTKSPRAMFI